MAQFAVPISTSSLPDGTFDVVPPQTPDSLFLNVDDDPEGVPSHDSDTSYLGSVPPFQQTVTFKLGPLLEPVNLFGIDLHVVHLRVEPITSENVTLWLYQGDPAIQQPPAVLLVRRTFFPSTIWIDNFIRLSPAQAAMITDWSDLHLRMELDFAVATGQIRVTSLYLKTPDPRIAAEPVESVDLVLDVNDVTWDPTQLKVSMPALEIELITKDVSLELGPLVLTPSPAIARIALPEVDVSSKLTLRLTDVDLEIRIQDPKVNRTLRPDDVDLEIRIQDPKVDRPITPATVVVELSPPAATVGAAFTPDSVIVKINVQDAAIIFTPLVLTPGDVDLELRLPDVRTTISPIILTPGDVDLELRLPDVRTTISPIILTPGDVDLELRLPTVTVLFGPRVVLPPPVIVEIAIQGAAKLIQTLDPDPLIIELHLPDVDVRIPYAVRITRTPRRGRRRRRSIHAQSTITPPGTFRGRFGHDARGLYRVFNPSEYRLYRRLLVPPEEIDAPYATSSTLPATPTDAFADGDWYLSVSYFNGAIDSGFLPLGANGETYLRLKIVSGALVGESPHGPGDWRLERRAGGVIAVVGFYYDASPLRALDWAVAYTTDGSEPPIDTPTVTVAMPASGVAVLDHELAAQADGTTVRVRLQTRRQGSFIYSEKSNVKSAVAAAATAAATVETRDRWTGRLPVDSRP